MEIRSLNESIDNPNLRFGIDELVIVPKAYNFAFGALAAPLWKCAYPQLKTVEDVVHIALRGSVSNISGKVFYPISRL